ncbi:phosphonate ABC transporter, permease protein PhnE [Lacticaseibacillus sharpeae]|uniref:ABC-type phosphate phosphonate transport system, permease component n=1 Tax=Lacticaseibacillus sharpeae JCM 1186 = DSM 20505 TaxID=1291052 RepID=A0A0R1ZJP8_9LACO|nr:phosphonate ABC transporter, permease protein PhnE [Lacticaseibacillus sharpeae]KRM54578.1 ABC-type phosphate phosphonate transport system, permease component [Lacticaseibacillus sharpeae JCM 1186 = DSM 20505]
MELPKRAFPWQKWVLSIVMVAGLIWSAFITDAHMGTFFANIDQFTKIFVEMCHVDWAYTPYVFDPMIETIKMAVLGTLIGSVLAFPYALLVARNIVTNKLVVGLFRFILNIVRTIPDLMLAALFVAVVGIGPVAGVITLAIFTFGMVGKLFYEAIETIDPGPLEALRAAGANTIEIIRFAVFPQIANYFVSYVLYAFEINVRASTVLGYLGAGGIGVYLQQSLSMFRYDRVGLMVLVIFIVVLLIDYVSGKTREALL